MMAPNVFMAYAAHEDCGELQIYAVNTTGLLKQQSWDIRFKGAL